MIAELFDVGNKKSVCNTVKSKRIFNHGDPAVFAGVVEVPITIVHYFNHVCNSFGREVIKCDLFGSTSFKKRSEVFRSCGEDELFKRDSIKLTRKKLTDLTEEK